MPELPEIETIRKELLIITKNKKIIKLQLNRKNLRFNFDKNLIKELEGREITDIERRSKYLLIHLKNKKNNKTLIIHLGMSGKFTIYTNNENQFKPLKHDHVIFNINNNIKIIYNDPRRFGFMLLTNYNNWKSHKLIKNIGPEPLTNNFNANYLAKKSINKRNIKNHLLNQKIIAGLGNIYVSEALFHAKINPMLPSKILVNNKKKPTQLCKLLVLTIKKILQKSIKLGGSSIKNYRKVNGNLGYFQNYLAVYNRENKVCISNSCNTKIKKIIQSNRSSFFCPKCQKI